MTPTPHACNYALLRFLPYPETGEFVNVGVLVACQQPCLLDFRMETGMTERLRTMFPQQDAEKFRDAAAAMVREMERVKGMIRELKSCRIAFNEAIRPRESILRFGEPRTILTDDAAQVADELFTRYVRMEKPAPPDSGVAKG